MVVSEWNILPYDTSNAPTLNSQVYLMFNAVLCNFAEETNIFITGWLARGAPGNYSFMYISNKQAKRPVNKKCNYAYFSSGIFCRIILSASLL